MLTQELRVEGDGARACSPVAGTFRDVRGCRFSRLGLERLRSWAETAWKWRSPSRVRGLQWWALIAALAAVLALHFHLAGCLVRETNLDLRRTDQRSYLDLAWESRADSVPKRVDGVRNSLWQWLAARVWLDESFAELRPPLSNEALEPYFVEGKWFNVWLTALFLIGFALACARFFPLVATLNLLVLADLGVMLPRATWFQPEALYCILSFASWVCAWRLLARNPLRLYALLGLLSGLAWLAKPATTPLLAVFLLASAYRWLGVRFPAFWRLPPTPPEKWSWKLHPVGLALLVACHGLVILPTAMESYRLFRDPFFSFPKYWMWQDDWLGEALPLMAKTDNGRTFHLLRKEERPSFRKWIDQYGWSAAGERLRTGVGAKLENLLAPHRHFWRWTLPKRAWPRLLRDRGAYLGIPLGLALALLAMALSRGDRFADAPELGAVVLFGLAVFSGYTLAYGWYDRIGRGDRFMMALFLPVLFMLMWGCERLKRRLDFAPAHWLYSGTQWFVLACLGTRVVQLLIHPVFRQP